MGARAKMKETEAAREKAAKEKAAKEAAEKASSKDKSKDVKSKSKKKSKVQDLGDGKRSKRTGVIRAAFVSRSDALQKITKGDVRRIARRGGCKRISADIYQEARKSMKAFVYDVVDRSITMMECLRPGGKTVFALDVVHALRSMNHHLYGHGNYLTNLTKSAPKKKSEETANKKDSKKDKKETKKEKEGKKDSKKDKKAASADKPSPKGRKSKK